MNQPAIDSFNEKFEPVTESGCWLWIASTNPKGYGWFVMDGKVMRANRASWLLHNGPIPEGLCVLHKCDVPSCVNPDHLFLGSVADNNADRHAKNHYALGQNHHYGKLDAEKVKEIRSGMWSDSKLASKFDVSRATIHSVRTGRTWKHIT